MGSLASFFTVNFKIAKSDNGFKSDQNFVLSFKVDLDAIKLHYCHIGAISRDNYK